MNMTNMLDIFSGLDGGALTVNAGLLLLLLKQHFSQSARISELESEIAMLKEKTSHTERDVDLLEQNYNQTTTELRYHLRYTDGKIHNRL